MSDDQVRARVVELTPALAEKLLRRNPRNRQVARRQVLQFARDIRNGDWQVNGEAIKISTEQQVLDGQHRLLAVIEADAPIRTVLITGLPPSAQETMDQGRPRSFSAILKIRGEADYNNLGAALRIVCLYERDGRPYTAGSPKPTTAEGLRTLARNPGIRDSLRLAARWAQPEVARSMVAAFHYLFAAVDEDEATRFWSRFAQAEGDDPPGALRAYLQVERLAARGLHARMKAELIVLAWNAYRRLEAFCPHEPSLRSAFPEIDGLAQREREAVAL